MGPPGIKGKDEIVDIEKFRKFVADEIVKVWQKYTDLDLDELKFCQIYGACDYKKSLKSNEKEISVCKVIQIEDDKLTPCSFPFVINGQTFYNCTDKKIGKLWCSTKTDPVTYERVSEGNHYGFCEKEHCPGLGNCQVIQQKDQKLKPCQFPFITEDGTNHHDCTNYQDPKGKFWCSTKTDRNTLKHVNEFWGYCEKEHCPDHLNGKNLIMNGL